LDQQNNNNLSIKINVKIIAIFQLNLQYIWISQNNKQRLELIINDKLSKLDLLDVLNDKLGKCEQNLSNMQTEIDNIKSVQQKKAQTLQNEEKHHHNIEDRIRELELCNRKLEFENYELNENILKSKLIP
jgi:DNA repair ATPase RecN